ncbi:hypothetical protein DOTSEDRAFT_23902 [Dothistroma septosporum NZE10]|uniref:Uncharacterized protein n=1 Tax=Dothistroma septosporum (strain NZE10 / CBS 128990) TaxID=675120 RepID=N1PMX7_DOTSN|nr:hypothetical protein DOTSEDRAFT_23902 [Dothistroma septosporum NZE10]
MVTQTALGMIERAGKEFVEQYPRIAEWDHVLEYLRISMGFNSNMVYLHCRNQDAFAAQTRATACPAGLLCATVSALLRVFAEAAYSFTLKVCEANIGTSEDTYTPKR